MNVVDLWGGIRGAMREWRRWSTITRNPDSIRVYYGYDHIATPLELLCGGMVKCQDLVRAFPNTLSDPNILYIVSSSLSSYVLSMARFAKRAGARVVINQNGVAYPAWHGPGWEQTNKPLSRLLALSDYVFYQSDFCKASADRYLGAAKAPFEILHNAVDTDTFRPTRARGPAGELTLLTAGSHTRRYRVTAAINTLAVLLKQGVRARLLVAGRCCWQDEKLACAEAAEHARTCGVSDRVEWLGPYVQKDAVPLFNRADILLHTVYNDSCPRLVIEAMACGVPVACSASGGVPELVGDSAGLSVPVPLDWEWENPPDPEALAEAVVGISLHLQDFSSAARERAVRLFDVKPWIERHRQVFTMLSKG